jgi:hypothetical protein
MSLETVDSPLAMSRTRANWASWLAELYRMPNPLYSARLRAHCFSPLVCFPPSAPHFPLHVAQSSLTRTGSKSFSSFQRVARATHARQRLDFLIHYHHVSKFQIGGQSRQRR